MPRWLILAAAIAASFDANADHWAATQLPPGVSFPTGEIIADVTCIADATQHYALYLPRDYSPERVWPLILFTGMKDVARFAARAAELEPPGRCARH